MSFMKKCLGSAAALAVMASAALAEPALMYDLGGKFDKSFNEAAFNGAKRWADETGGSYREIEVTVRSPARTVRHAALPRPGSTRHHVPCLDSRTRPRSRTVAPKYPDTKFVNHRR